MSEPVSHTRLATYREIISIGEGLGFPDDFDKQQQRAPEDNSPLQIQPMEESSDETPLNSPHVGFWMDPNAKFHPTDYHPEFAEEYLDSIGEPVHHSLNSYNPSLFYDEMFKRGWIRILKSTDARILHFEYGNIPNPIGKVSNNQMRELKNTAIELNYSLMDDTWGRKRIELMESLLFEDILRAMDDYWMDPSSKLHKCSGHAYWGLKYLLKHEIPFDSEKTYTIYEALFAHGFIRVKIKTGQLYIEYSRTRKPSNHQWRTLKNLAIENNLKLVDDSGDSAVEIDLNESINHNSGIFISESIMKPEEKEEFKSLLAKLFSHLRNELKLKTLPSIHLISDPVNAKKILGKTGYYDSNNKKICLFITDRHPKDILRSFAHEVIHHWQHENKQLDKSKKAGESDPQYAQNDPWMRQMEKQAYLLGNILFRDWEDGKKATDKQSQMENRRLKKKVLREHPESMFGHGWLDSSCVGPFVIFHNNNDPRYIFSDRNNSTLYLDGEEVSVSDISSHGGLLVRLNKIDSSINNKSFESVSGRIWDIEDTIYVGLWSDMKQIKKFGKSKFLASLTKLMAECLGVKIQNVMFNVYTDGEMKADLTPVITYEEFLVDDSGKETDLEKQAKEKELHMMDPSYKGQMMKQMGIKPKTPSEVPDFKKKQLTGIDELGSI